MGERPLAVHNDLHLGVLEEGEFILENVLLELLVTQLVEHVLRCPLAINHVLLEPLLPHHHRKDPSFHVEVVDPS